MPARMPYISRLLCDVGATDVKTLMMMMMIPTEQHLLKTDRHIGPIIRK